MSDSDVGISPFEQEWRTCVTVIQAAAEILRDHDMADSERERFIDAIIDGNGRLTRSFGSVFQISESCSASRDA